MFYEPLRAMKKIYAACLLILLALVLTGCHEGDGIFHWVVAEAPPVAIEPDVLPPIDAEDVVVVPEEEVGELDPDPTLEPPSLDIKGNINAQGVKIAHAPGDPNYDQVKIDETKGERWFRTMEEAIEAGWRPIKR